MFAAVSAFDGLRIRLFGSGHTAKGTAGET